jgi:hypothetical protein
MAGRNGNRLLEPDRKEGKEKGTTKGRKKGVVNTYDTGLSGG